MTEERLLSTSSLSCDFYLKTSQLFNVTNPFDRPICDQVVVRGLELSIVLPALGLKKFPDQ